MDKIKAHLKKLRILTLILALTVALLIILITFHNLYALFVPAFGLFILAILYIYEIDVLKHMVL
jgi:hypothetical protein